MRMRGISSPAPAGAGWARATLAIATDSQQVDSADSRTGRRIGPPGRFIGSSVSPSRVFARELDHHALAVPSPARPGGGGGTCPVARTAVMHGSSNRSLPDDCRSCGDFNVPSVSTRITTSRDHARQLGVVQQARGHVPVPLDGVVYGGRVFVALHVLVGSPGQRSPSAAPSPPPWRRWPAPAPASAPAACPWRSSCPRAWAPPSAAAAASGGGVTSGFSFSFITGSGRVGSGGCHDPGQPELLPRLAELHHLVTIRSRMASGRGADLRCDWYTSSSQRPVDGQGDQQSPPGRPGPAVETRDELPSRSRRARHSSGSVTMPSLSAPASFMAAMISTTSPYSRFWSACR